jgi:ubiquinol-cytochrome c reductase cytochrome b subunit
LLATSAARRLKASIDGLKSRSVPLHWSNTFGVVSMASLMVLFVTGVFLMFVYIPSSEQVEYSGDYTPLAGTEMSKAFASTLSVSFDIPGGLLMRQAHHWAALLLPASLIMQLLASFFTGAFRRPRQWSWVLLFLIFVMTLATGWSGYALPDDMLSGTGLRIVEGVLLGIPFIGVDLSMMLFGGAFPGRVIEHLYPLHVLVTPAALILFLFLRIRSILRHRPAQFAGPGRTERNVVGIPLLPQMATRAAGLLLIVAGTLFAIAATVTVAPVWTYGPSSPGDASAGSQPDWYTGFLDGALRLVPPGWEFEWLGRTWTLAVLVPLAVVGLFFVAVACYPFVEAWITDDREEHHLLDRPRDRPVRTGIGAAGMVFYGGLWGAASADLIATQFHVGLEDTIRFFQVVVLLGPWAAFEAARRVCHGLREKDRDTLRHGYETGRILRLPGGRYVEVHGPHAEPDAPREARPVMNRAPQSDNGPAARRPHPGVTDHDPGLSSR